MFPKVDKPIYETEIPSSGRKVKYIPFSVKEEKIVLMANESEDPIEIISAMKQLINNCVLDTINVDELSIFDIEWLYIQLKSKASGSVINCVITDEGEEYPVRVNLLEDIVLVKPTNHTNTIILDEGKGIGVRLRYPSISTVLNMEKNDALQASFDIIYDCTELVFDQDSVYPVREEQKQEYMDFLDSLSLQQLELIINFFKQQPYMLVKIKYRNKNGEEKTYETRQIRDFL